MTRATKRALSTATPQTDGQPRQPGENRYPTTGPGVRPPDHPNGRDVYDGWRLELTPGEWRHLKQCLASLTEREREVACAVCAGGANEAVADRLCIALPTLRTHLMRIYQKLGAGSKSDLIRHITAQLLDGYRRGAIEPEPNSRSNSLQARDISIEWPVRVVPGPAGKSSVSMTTSGPTSGQ
ncbi:MAG: LuxR family transcriptional regulator [Phycisphaeraceae bacterium]|nr:MAG: LuxR family transcriptional regulator [Phycisphaeraceae bacterium]